MTQGYSIQWDPSLPPFAGPGADLPDVGYAIEAMADGTSFGNPEALIEVVKSLLTDGSLAVLEGWDNRQAPIRLRLSAPTSVAGPALAEAEKALMLAVQASSKAPLVYVPPAQDAVTCVFDVVAAKLERDVSDGWDIDEIRREYRFYLLTLTCLPFAHPPNTVVVPALALPPGSPTTVVIDTCDSTTGWSGVSSSNVTGTSLTASSGYVEFAGTGTGSGQPPSIGLTRTGSVTMGATPYLRITISAQNAWDTSPDNSFTFTAGGVTSLVRPIATAATAGSVDYYVQPPASFDSMTVRGYSYGTEAAPIWRRVHEVARTDTIPGSGTTRQRARTAAVSGSAPTQAAIRLFDATPADLGDDILVYTSRNVNLSPQLRPWRVTSASVTPDTARISGGRNNLSTPMVFRIPTANLNKGTYALLANINAQAPGDLSWSARMVDAAGSTTLGSTVTTSGTVSLTTGGYKVLNLGALSLPVVSIEGDQLVELTLTGTSDLVVDEGWLFDLDNGALTWVRNTASDLHWIEIRSPELAAARPSVYAGTGAVGSNPVCIDYMCESFGAHRFEPGLMQVFTVASSSLVTQSELEFYPRYHSHVEGSAA